MGTEARQLLEANGKNSVYNESYAGSCMKKWESMLVPINKADPIRNPYIRKVTAVLLENEADFMKTLHEDTTTSNVAYFTKFVFPALRRVWPNLIANQVTSVFPMSGPTGAVAYYEKKYDNRKGNKITQSGVSGVPTSMTYTGALAAGDNMIQNFAKNYASEYVPMDVCVTNTGVASATLNNTIANCRIPAWGPIRDNAVDGQRTYSVKAYYRILDADAANADTAVVATMNDAGNLIDGYSNTVGTFNVSTKAWTITPLGSAGTASNFVNNTTVYFSYYINYELVYQTAGAAIPSVSLGFTLHPLVAEKTPLKAKWTVESVEDMKALYGIEVEAELVSDFSNEVMLEIDRQIIDDLVAQSGHAASYTYSATVPGEIESIRSLITKIGAVSARIHQTSLRGKANFIVVPPGIESLLDQLSTHGDYAAIEQDVVAASYGPVSSNTGISRVGTLRNSLAVYVDPFMDSTKILVGLKDSSFLHSGYAYCPYVPIQVTPTFLNPEDQTYAKGMWTRFAKKMLRPEYYGVITCSGLPSVTTAL